MKYFILLIYGFLIVESIYSQNIKKFLTNEELNQFDKTDSIYKQINDLAFDEGFTGTLLIKKIDGRLKSIEIGTWIRNNSKYGDNAIMVWDSVGRVIDYKEYNKNRTIGFDCQYWYESINGKYYRLENMAIFNESGNLIIRGHRYWKTTKDKFGFYNLSRQRRFGKWEYFDSQGSLIEIKEYDEIK